jgi:hypothetical protein
VTQSLNRLKELTKGLAVAVDRPSEADWFLRLLPDGRAVLVPASGLPRTATRSTTPQGAFVVASAVDDTFESKLSETAMRLARARNLLAIAGTGGEQGSDGPAGLTVKLELLRYSSAAGSGEPVEFGPGGRVLRLDESVAFRLSNVTDTDVDVTLLLVDADFKIQSLFPMRGDANNRLDRGKTFTTQKLTVEGPVGAEQVVMIAVPAGAPPVSFAALEQDPLTRTRSATAPTPSTPLGRLLGRAMDGTGTTRSLRAAEVASYSMTLLSWRTEPAQ